MTFHIDGVGVALVTMFDRQGRVDAAATAEHAHNCAERGIRSILVAGTTGEPWRLSTTDRIVLAAAVKDAVSDVPVIVGTGDTNAVRALQITKEVAAAGVADSLLVLSPTDVDPAGFYRDVVSAAATCTVLAYHLPALSPPGIPADLVRTLPVGGIKDSSGDADRLAQLVHDGCPTFVGSPNLLSTAGPCGAAGALLALANSVPELCLDAWSGDEVAQRRLFDVHIASLVDFPATLKPGSRLMPRTDQGQ
jgi:4-hydroxy-tetrahydrodipicolinate synthase